METIKSIPRDVYYLSLPSEKDCINVQKIVHTAASFAEQRCAGRRFEIRAVGGSVRDETFGTKRKDYDLLFVLVWLGIKCRIGGYWPVALIPPDPAATPIELHSRGGLNKPHSILYP